jgi:hypothetical protein
MTSRKIVLSFAVLLLAPLALAEGTYTQIDVPGATRTQCVGIDNAGDVSGFYQDASGTYHGFVLSGGSYTIINYQGQGTFVYGINDVGQVVGLSTVGFVYNVQTQTFETIGYPGASVTYPYAINNAGTVVGYFQQGEQIEGFELVGSTYTEIVAPLEGNPNTYVRGITTAGELVLFGTSVTKEGNFLYANGKYHGLSFNGEVPDAEVNGIASTREVVVGQFQPNRGPAVAGFLDRHKIPMELEFPGATNTFPSGVNDTGETVGYFEDASNSIHGFTWTPPAPMEKK